MASVLSARCWPSKTTRPACGPGRPPPPIDKAMVRASKKILVCPSTNFSSSSSAISPPAEVSGPARRGSPGRRLPGLRGHGGSRRKRHWKNSRCAGGRHTVWSKSGTCVVARFSDRLRGLYDEETIHPGSGFQGCFNVRWNYFSMSTPQVLQTISAKLFTREKPRRPCMDGDAG